MWPVLSHSWGHLKDRKTPFQICNIWICCYFDFQDNKFNTASDGNWRPEHAGTAVQRSSNWEDGLGRGDIEKNRKERKRLVTKRDANERYHAQIANDSLEKQQKERARQDYHRLVQFFVCPYGCASDLNFTLRCTCIRCFQIKRSHIAGLKMLEINNLPTGRKDG